MYPHNCMHVLQELYLAQTHTHTGESAAGCTFKCSWQRCGYSLWWLPPSMQSHPPSHTHIHTHHMKAFPRRNAPWVPASLPLSSSSSWLRSVGYSPPFKCLKEDSTRNHLNPLKPSCLWSAFDFLALFGISDALFCFLTLMSNPDVATTFPWSWTMAVVRFLGLFLHRLQAVR